MYNEVRVNLFVFRMILITGISMSVVLIYLSYESKYVVLLTILYARGNEYCKV